jgi:hypothetical protein
MMTTGSYSSPDTRKSRATVVGTSDNDQFSETMSYITFEEVGGK